MNSTLVTEGKKHVSALESSLATLFAKTPHLPHNIVEILVVIAPWLALLFGVLGVIALIPMLMLIPMASFSAPMMGAVAAYGWYPMMIVGFFAGIVSTILNFLAFSPLLKRMKKGWNLLFYSTLLSVVVTLVQIVFGSSGALSIIGSLVGLWLLFEVRGQYHQHA
jgi:phosphoglycerol transferase MdoB-like AlkP superfamily enzyme